jgi:hypothetical protein
MNRLCEAVWNFVEKRRDFSAWPPNRLSVGFLEMTFPPTIPNKLRA